MYVYLYLYFRYLKTVYIWSLKTFTQVLFIWVTFSFPQIIPPVCLYVKMRGNQNKPHSWASWMVHQSLDVPHFLEQLLHSAELDLLIPFVEGCSYHSGHWNHVLIFSWEFGVHIPTILYTTTFLCVSCKLTALFIHTWYIFKFDKDNREIPQGFFYYY